MCHYVSFFLLFVGVPAHNKWKLKALESCCFSKICFHIVGDNKILCCRLYGVFTPIKSSVATGTSWLWCFLAQNRARTPGTLSNMSLCTMTLMNLVRSYILQTNQPIRTCYLYWYYFNLNTNMMKFMFRSNWSSFVHFCHVMFNFIMKNA